MVIDGEVLIVDEHTGRVLPGRRYNDGMHQAIEAKEARGDQGLRTRPWPPSPCRTTSACTTSSFGHDRYRRDRGRRVHRAPTSSALCPSPPTSRCAARRPPRSGVPQRRVPSSTPSSTTLTNATRRASRSWWAPPAWRSSEYLSRQLARSAGVRHEVLNAKQQRA